MNKPRTFRYWIAPHCTQRHVRPVLCFILACCAALLTPWSASADDVAAYLERHGLKQLLAVHLQQQMQSAQGEQRDQLAIRLARLYAELLEQIDDPILRTTIEQQSIELLGDVPDRHDDALRLALLRAQYRTVERVFEDHRLRLVNSDELSQAQSSLNELIPKLNDLLDQIERNHRALDQQLSKARGLEARTLSHRVDRTRALLNECRFLLAWANYYQAWLNDTREQAREAQFLFANVLQLPIDRMFPDEVSVDLRSREAIARAILGMALSKSRTASSDSALQWVQLLEHPRTFQPLRAQTPIWKIFIHMQHGEFAHAHNIVRTYIESQQDEPIDPVWLRLIAVHALESIDTEPQALSLARFAMAELTASGKLDQVLNIADRYGTEALGDRGFAAHYVSGVLTYNTARREHGSNKPAEDDQVIDLYTKAIEKLTAALQTGGTSQYPTAMADAQRLIAWSTYYLGRYRDAADAFQQASARLDPQQAPDALWMAVVCLDELSQSSPSPTVAEELRQTADRFLEQYPSSQYAPKLILRRAMHAEQPSETQIEQLLSVPPESDVYRSARQQAANMLYQLFRSNQPPARQQWGMQYIDVAAPLLRSDQLQLGVPDAEIDINVLVNRCRRLLEVALYQGVERVDAAQTALSTLDLIDENNFADVDQYESELEYRRTRLRALAGDLTGATRLADTIWKRDETSRWADLAARVVLHEATARWKQAQQNNRFDRQALNLVIQYGRRIVQRHEQSDGTLDARTLSAYRGTLAEALKRRWEVDGGADNAEAALQQINVLLQTQPNNRRFLRAAGLLAEAADRPQRALQCWRRIVSGTDEQAEGWYEAKYHVIKLLIQLDSAKAREVMDQHKHLHPEYGPPPWDAKLRELDERLDEARASDTPASDESDEPDESQSSGDRE